MDFFDILIPIIVILGPIIGKSLKDKEKIEKERSKRIGTVTTKSNIERQYVPKKRLETRANPKNQNLFQNKNYEDNQVYDDYKKINNYTLNEKRDMGEGIDEEQLDTKSKVTKKDISNPILQFTKNDIVKGVIMSELLGKPKSLTRR